MPPAKPSRPAEPATPVTAGPVPGGLEVYVRMYRALAEANGKTDPGYDGMLGDCFLIRMFDSATRRKSHIMIDCGLLMGSVNDKARAKRIAEDIVKTTSSNESGPGELDLLVITHEHWDHLSGFSQAQDILLNPARLRIANLWMAWTEKDGDAQADRLRERFDKSGVALAALSVAIAKSARTDADRGNVLSALQGFQGQLSADGKIGKALPGREIMRRLKEVTEKSAFLEPGAVLQTPAIAANGPSIKAFVLGPPRNEERLFKDKPSSGKKQETYFEAVAFSKLALAALGVDGEPDASSGDVVEVPFARGYRKISAKDLEARKNSRAAQGPDEAWLVEHYYGTENTPKTEAELIQRRQIGDDWIAAAGPLALKLDSDTNNTSLVLAFELPGGTVMLFPGDAQVGNWESWHDQKYRDETGTEHTAEQILNRVQFYKVGHHGSHNATMRQHGLDMMTRPDLVAAIPTDEAFGKKQGGGWQMPNPRVNQALLERTAGRILRNDRRYTKSADLEPFGKLAGKDRLTDDILYLEYRVL